MTEKCIHWLEQASGSFKIIHYRNFFSDVAIKLASKTQFPFLFKQRAFKYFIVFVWTEIKLGVKLYPVSMLLHMMSIEACLYEANREGRLIDDSETTEFSKMKYADQEGQDEEFNELFQHGNSYVLRKELDLKLPEDVLVNEHEAQKLLACLDFSYREELCCFHHMAVRKKTLSYK